MLERQPDIGDLGHIRFAGSLMYESAHFISSKTLSGFRDFSMPQSYPDHPSHRQVLAYLHSYADRHGVRAHARFGTPVREARPDGDAWAVELEDGTMRRYDGVVLATGQQWMPKTPALPGRFDGEAFHSSVYRSAGALEGKRVLVVGGGNSACDIAVDAVTRASRVFLSVRRGYWFIPKHIFGMPADALASWGRTAAARRALLRGAPPAAAGGRPAAKLGRPRPTTVCSRRTRCSTRRS